MPGDAETILARSATRFNGALIAVRENKASDQSIIERIEPAWLQLRDLVTVTSSKASFAKIDALAESILQSAELLTRQLATALGIQSARLTDLSGRQRMLSQRMGKCAFAMMWGQDGSAFGQQLDAAQSQFRAAFNTLKSTKLDSMAVARNLELAELQYGFFDSALNPRGDLSRLAPARAANVAKTNERLLELFDELTGQFASVQG